MNDFCRRAHGDINQINNILASTYMKTGIDEAKLQQQLRPYRANGLAEACLDHENAKPMEQVEQEIVAWLGQHFKPREAKLLGNSVWTDRVHLMRHMPFFEKLFHHRLIDISSRWEQVVMRYGLDKEKPMDNHRALPGLFNTVDLHNFLCDFEPISRAIAEPKLVEAYQYGRIS
jgi:oligoribonuclease (3'-5' exoribonuclease)